MTKDAIAKSIKVFLSGSHGGMYAHSPDLPGLSVWGNDENELEARVIEGVRALYKLNWDVDVTVFVSRDPADRQPVRAASYREFTLAQAA